MYAYHMNMHTHTHANTKCMYMLHIVCTYMYVLCTYIATYNKFIYEATEQPTVAITYVTGSAKTSHVRTW